MKKGDLMQSLSKFPLQKSACWALDNSRGVVDLSMIAYTGFASNFWIKGGPQFLSKCSAFFHFLCKPLDSYLQCTELWGYTAVGVQGSHNCSIGQEVSVILTHRIALDTGLDRWPCWKWTGLGDGIVLPAFAIHKEGPGEQQKKRLILDHMLLL